MIGKRSSFFNLEHESLETGGCWGGTIGVLKPTHTGGADRVQPQHRHHTPRPRVLVHLEYRSPVPQRLRALLQAPGHITTFCRQQLNAPIASPALFPPLLERFTHAVDAFAELHDV